MKSPMDALELLKSQHDEVDELIERIEGSDDDGEKAEVFKELANKLAAHAAMEENLFYPWILTRQTEEILREIGYAPDEIARLRTDGAV